MTLGRLHLVTPADLTAESLHVVQAVLEAGAPLIQVRLKHRTDRQRFTVTQAVRAICRPHDATCIVNDRADLALAVGAHGVHVGSDDLPTETVRSMLGPAAVVGATARNPDDARQAELAGASYVGAGPVYETSTKEGLPSPIGPDGVEAIASAVSIPVIAISGVTPARVPELLEAGAHGIAAVGAVFFSADPSAAVANFLDALGEPVPTRRPTRGPR